MSKRGSSGKSTERLRRLRRAAAFDLFRACDLGPPPRSLWRFVDDANDVGRGVGSFLRAVGTDGGNIELTELIRAETALNACAPGQARMLRDELVCGDPTRVAAAVRTLRHQASRSVARNRQGISVYPLADAHHRLRRDLAASWPEAWIDTPAGERVRALLDEYEQTELSLQNAAGTIANDIASVQRRLNGELAALADMAGRAGPGDPPPDAGSIAPASGEAEAFSIALDRTTDVDAGLALWLEFRWRHHPERPGLDPVARAAAERAVGMADQALDDWERSVGVGGPAQP